LRQIEWECAIQEQIDYRGMTVNERLYAAGLMADWEKAALARDRDRMVEILSKVGLAGQATTISEKILATPNFYGF
jgi:hypothetical protein